MTSPVIAFAAAATAGGVALAAAAAATAVTATAASGQEAFEACRSQQSLEQVIASDGDLMPEDCRRVEVTEVASDHGPLCVIDFSGAGEGVLETLREAALPEEWWVRCESLGGAP